MTDWKLRRDGEEVMTGQWIRWMSADGKTQTLKVNASDSGTGGTGEATLVYVKKPL